MEAITHKPYILSDTNLITLSAMEKSRKKSGKKRTRGENREKAEMMSTWLVYLKAYPFALQNELARVCHTSSDYMKHYVIKSMIKAGALKKVKRGPTGYGYQLTKKGLVEANYVYAHAQKKDMFAKIYCPLLCNNDQLRKELKLE